MSAPDILVHNDSVRRPMRIVIELTERLTDLLTPLLFELGATSDPTDNCECLYLTFGDWITVVFQLFA